MTLDLDLKPIWNIDLLLVVSQQKKIESFLSKRPCRLCKALCQYLNSAAVCETNNEQERKSREAKFYLYSVEEESRMEWG